MFVNGHWIIKVREYPGFMYVLHDSSTALSGNEMLWACGGTVHLNVNNYNVGKECKHVLQ